MGINTASTSTPLGLFQAYGVEIEYMIVDRNTLDVLPATDRLFKSVCGSYLSDIEKDGISWSNELALHVVELKTAKPAQRLEGLEILFQKDVAQINTLLEPMQGMLLPTAMHPWMVPDKDFKLWPHEQNEVYSAFNDIFNCSGHGWANLQSAHLNLPFANEEEFVRLHAAIRLILPLIPALAASSPLKEGKLSGLKDTRLEVYRTNCIKIPSITGSIIPEVCLSYADYHENILNKLYKDIAPYDSHGILQHEWLNARGAIARFDRNAIEIRLIDTQEAPAADLAITHVITSVIKALVEEKWTSLETLHTFSEILLKELLLTCIKNGEKTIIADQDYLKVFGWNTGHSCRANDLWMYLVEKTMENHFNTYKTIKHILKYGTLATRIQQALGPKPEIQAIHAVYLQLAQNLAAGTLFTPSLTS